MKKIYHITFPDDPRTKVTTKSMDVAWTVIQQAKRNGFRVRLKIEKIQGQYAAHHCSQSKESGYETY